MKIPFFKSVAFPFLIATVFLLSTAQTCDDGEDQLPECWKYYGNLPAADFEVPNVSLRYDLDAYAKDAWSRFYFDLMELEEAHSIFVIYPYSANGSVYSLSNILNTTAVEISKNESSKPYIKFWFYPYTNACQGNVSKEYTPDEVEGNTLKNSPGVVKKSIATLSYTVKSIKTNNNGLQLVWDQTIAVPSDNLSKLKFNANAQVGASVTPVLATRSKSDQVAVRNASDSTRAGGRSVSVVENTVQEGTMSGHVRKSSDEMIISPLLQKEIYVGGKPDKNIVWNAPEWYDIMK